LNILLVDDDECNRKIIADLLQDIGHKVEECSNGKKALACFQGANFHMIMSDLKMPQMSGIELLQTIKSLPGGEHTDFVLFTGYADLHSAIAALRAGAYDYILKPINVEELIAITEKVADHQALRHENKILTENFNAEVRMATQETQDQLLRLKQIVAESLGVGEVAVFSDKMQHVVDLAHKYAEERTLPVLIQGETGTGKEVVARLIHCGKLDGFSPLVDVNCAALTPSLFESELFGYESGAFTGAQSKGQKGKFDLAAGGTLFLDEVGEIPLELQGKLLRVIQEKEYYRVGGLKKIKADVRIICATNAELEKKVEQGTFRRDLYYRLKVGFIKIPPLRERKAEIIPMANMFLQGLSKMRGKHFTKISAMAEPLLLAHHWPGNVRELKNAMEWIVFMYDDKEVWPKHLEMITGQEVEMVLEPDLTSFNLPPQGLNIDQYMLQLIVKALALHGGNKTSTAQYLGISRKSLYRRLKHAEL
jgi:DNA-binding NtrC family response regulator